MIHTIAEDCRTPLGPYIRIASKGTLLRLLRYLGANDEDMTDVEQELRQWNRGGVHLDVPVEKLGLLRLRYCPAAAHVAAQHPCR